MGLSETQKVSCNVFLSLLPMTFYAFQVSLLQINSFCSNIIVKNIVANNKGGVCLLIVASFKLLGGSKVTKAFHLSPIEEFIGYNENSQVQFSSSIGGCKFFFT
jgi:hypothetical protein